jgi:hypothetical protein
MVAVVTELMVGGERSTQDDSTKDPIGLWSLSSDSERCPSSGRDNFVLDNIFALIDGIYFRALDRRFVCLFCVASSLASSA